MEYNIISTGSKGNAVKIENLLVDCGVPMRSLKEHLYKVKYLFITHGHSDHLNMKTFRSIISKFPGIKIMGNHEVAQMVPVDKITAENIPVKLAQMTIIPFEVPHDITCQGLTIQVKKEFAIYVTDSGGTKTWPKGEYDYLFLESNHDENIINRVKNSEYGYDVFQNSKRHTSIQEAKAFYYMNRKRKDSELIELHMSERFR